MVVKYFIYSREQFNMKKELANKISQEYKPGLVFVGNSSKEFTDIIDSPAQAKFSDSIVVASGDLSKMKYKLGSEY